VKIALVNVGQIFGFLYRKKMNWGKNNAHLVFLYKVVLFTQLPNGNFTNSDLEVY
jgi:hypothetical protein